LRMLPENSPLEPISVDHLYPGKGFARKVKAIGATPRMIQLRADVPVSSRLIRSDLLPVWWER